MTRVGDTVGRIRVIDTLSKGGMGDVYLGWDDTLKRRVTLKAIPPEQRMDPEARARFLRETRVLSQLDHPGICRIHEIIEQEQGDYLVLELITGQSLREALLDDLEVPFKLLIAGKVAEALAVAHSEGVVHRDLKPENVLLTEEGSVKVLDFGLAQAVDPMSAGSEGGNGQVEPRQQEGDAGATETTADHSSIETATERGTLAYMSPEQARGERVSSAGDMYSLGLMLQELFTGEQPYGETSQPMELLAKAAQGETIPVANGLDPELKSLIERLKSMTPEVRPTAAETAERLWRIRGKGRRRLGYLAAGVALLLLLFGGARYFMDLRQERTRALAAQQEAEDVTEFLTSLFAVSDPSLAEDRQITALELLDAGTQRIASLDGQPLRQAHLMRVTGRAYRQLGHYDEARPLLEKALEIYRGERGEDLESTPYLDQLAGLYRDIGDLGSAEELFRRALEVRQQDLDPLDPRLAASFENLGLLYRARGASEQAELLFLQAFEVLRHTQEGRSAAVASVLGHLGELYRERGDLAQAEPFLRRSLEIQQGLLGADHPSLVAVLDNLAIVLQDQGKGEAAEPLYRRALGIGEQTLRGERSQLAVTLNHLAELYRLTGRYADAEPLYRRALDIQETTLGAGHPDLATTLGNLAELYAQQGDIDRAEPLYGQALEIQDEHLGGDHPALAVTFNHLGDLRLAQGDLQAAEALYESALEIQRGAYGRDHPAVAQSLGDLAGLYTRQRRYAEAASLYGLALDIADRLLLDQPEHAVGRTRLAALQVGLGELYQARGEQDRATELWELAAASMANLTRGSGVIERLHTYALALLHLDRLVEARPVVEKLQAVGWSQPEFLRLTGEKGLLEGSSSGLQ